MKGSRKLLSPKDVAELYGLSEELQDRLRRRRVITFHKVSGGRSGSVLYRVEDIESWFDRTRVPAKDELRGR